MRRLGRKYNVPLAALENLSSGALAQEISIWIAEDVVYQAERPRTARERLELRASRDPLDRLIAERMAL
jgi:hypothetical protein